MVGCTGVGVITVIKRVSSEVGSGRSKLWELVSDRVSMGMELASNDVVPIIGTDVWSRISGDETIVDKLLASTL